MLPSFLSMGWNDGVLLSWKAPHVATTARVFPLPDGIFPQAVCGSMPWALVSVKERALRQSMYVECQTQQTFCPRGSCHCPAATVSADCHLYSAGLTEGPTC